MVALWVCLLAFPRLLVGETPTQANQTTSRTGEYSLAHPNFIYNSARVARTSSSESDGVDVNIRLLSYNIFLRPPAPRFTHNVVNDYKDRRLSSFITMYLNRYDIICLQEMFGSLSSRRARLIQEASLRGFKWVVQSHRPMNFLVDGGLLILSRVKIAAYDYTVFQPGVMSDRLSAKGALYAKLEPSPGTYIHLFVTHLQAVYADPKSNAKCLEVQYRQYDELTNFIRATIRANDSAGPGRRWPILVTGDFNCNSRSPRDGTQSTVHYRRLTESLSRIGQFHDVLFEKYQQHPVTYAYAHFQADGSFIPAERALTHPDDYAPSGEHVNQSLDYVFLFPSIQTEDATIKSARVGHLKYYTSPISPPAPNLEYLSDHLGVETEIHVR